MILLNKFIIGGAPNGLHKMYCFKDFNKIIDLKLYHLIKNKCMSCIIYWNDLPNIVKHVYFYSGYDGIYIPYNSPGYLGFCHFKKIALLLATDELRTKKYYRLFYDMTREDFKKRKDVLYQQVVWPVYKLPITIQNPYV